MHKGTPPEKKNVFFRALPKLPLPAPSPHFGQLVPLFQTSKTTFCAYDRKNANHDNDDCDNKYDVNFDDNDDKNYQINIQILRVWGKNLPFFFTKNG